MEQSMVEKKKLETIYFDFHWPKYVDENLKHEKNKKKNKKPQRLKNYCPNISMEAETEKW